MFKISAVHEIESLSNKTKKAHANNLKQFSIDYNIYEVCEEGKVEINLHIHIQFLPSMPKVDFAKLSVSHFACFSSFSVHI